MPKPENIKGKGFDKRPHNINKKGRPPKLLNHILEELKAEGYDGIKQAHVIEAYELLLNLPLSKIHSIANGKGIYEMHVINGKDTPVYVPEEKEYTVLVRIVAKELVSKKGFDAVEKIFDRIHGKPKISVESRSEHTVKQVFKIGDQEIEF